MTKAQWAETLEPGLREFIVDAFDTTPQLYPEIFHTDTSERAYEEDVDATGIGYLESTGEKQPPKYEDQLQGYKTRYTHVTYRKGIEVSQEEYDDDQYRIFKRRSTTLGKSAKRTYDYQAFSVFRNAFNTAYTSYGDTKPLCSTTHTRQDGGTAQSNASAIGIQLTETNLETAILALQQVVDHKGQVVSIGDGNLILLVPLALRKTAKIIAGSELRPGVANNDLNVYYGMNITVVATRWISAIAGGSNTAWFVLDPGSHGLNFFMREAFNIDDIFDKELRTLKMIANTRFSFGWSHWFGLWGSKGDDLAYSS